MLFYNIKLLHRVYRHKQHSPLFLNGRRNQLSTLNIGNNRRATDWRSLNTVIL